MNGAESLVRTLVESGLKVCFTNPGTSEMHFVAALDRIPGLHTVLCLFEGVTTGAADGYYRMSGNPAATLLHLGPGLANALSCQHNARKARSGMVNIIGDHATYHLAFNAPLTSDVEAVARPFSDWVKTSRSSASVARDGAEAIAEARRHPGHIASLILPADTAWGEAESAALAPEPPRPPRVEEDRIDETARYLGDHPGSLLLLGGEALYGRGLTAAGRIAQATGAQLMAEMSNGRIERGAGQVPIRRIPYPIDQALGVLAAYDKAVLAGSSDPVAFFAYPGKPSRLLSDHCRPITLASREEDVSVALEDLAEALDAGALSPDLQPEELPGPVSGELTPERIGKVIARTIPENGIVVDEAITTGRSFFDDTRGTRPHAWLQGVGGSIGHGPPMATGAAMACPERKVLTLQADGSALYTAQAYWTQARESLDITTVVFNNRAYRILQGEMRNVGVTDPGERARDMLELERPVLDWQGLAKGFAVDFGRAETCEELTAEIERGLSSGGPYLIEAVL
jgi:acetolactate synthase-1/2/3 large subunit